MTVQRNTNGDSKRSNNISTVGEKLLIEKLSSITVTELEALASNGETKLASGRFARDFKIPDGKGGWKFILIPAGNGQDKQTLILLPDNNRTRGVWVAGQTKYAIREGLPALYAEVWASARLTRRHEMLPMLAEIMKDDNLIDAYLDFPLTITLQALADWIKTYDIKDNYPSGVRLLLSKHVEILETGMNQLRKDVHKSSTLHINPLLLVTREREAQRKFAEKYKDDEALADQLTAECVRLEIEQGEAEQISDDPTAFVARRGETQSILHVDELGYASVEADADFSVEITDPTDILSSPIVSIVPDYNAQNDDIEAPDEDIQLTGNV